MTCPICGSELRVINEYGTPYCHYLCDLCGWKTGKLNRYEERER